MTEYNYVAFVARLAKEGRAAEFCRQEEKIPRDKNYFKALKALCEKFGIKETPSRVPDRRRRRSSIEIYGAA